MIRVRVKTLPEELQYANLCRVHTSVMDTLGVSPGEFLLVQIPGGPEKWPPSEKIPFQGTESFVRVWSRCPGLHLVPFGGDGKPEIELDPSLLEYLGMSEGDELLLRKDFGETSRLSFVRFRTNASLTEGEQKELCNIIKRACWPVYPGASFAINLSGEPILLQVNSSFRVPAVIALDTVVNIADAAQLEDLRIQSEILAFEVSIQRLKKQKTLLCQDKETLTRTEQQLLEETANAEDQEKRLREENENCSKDLSLLPEKEEKLRTELMNLEEADVQLRDRLKKLEGRIPSRLDLQPKKKERDRYEEEFEKSLAKFENNLRAWNKRNPEEPSRT